MKVQKIEEIHKKYEKYVEGYCLLGSYSIFIPFFKIYMRMDYTYESDLTIIESFICKCITRGVRKRIDIAEVLGIEEEMLKVALSSMIENEYLQQKFDEEGNAYYDFSEIGKKLIAKNRKYEPKSLDVEWFYDGLNPEYKLEFYGTEHQFVKYRDISKEEKNIIILPRVFPKYTEESNKQQLSKRVLDVLSKNRLKDSNDLKVDYIVNIDAFHMLQEREICYHEYRILTYRNEEGAYRLLAYDPCGLEYIDPRVTESILQLYEEGKFCELLDNTESSNESIAEIIDALKNYASELIISEENDKEEHEKIKETVQKLEVISKKKVKSEYIMNYDIRKLFLEYMENAKESLFIISPWMNYYVVNEDLKQNIIKLLERGVKVRIIYGIAEEHGSQNERDEKTNKIANELLEVAKSYGDLFKMKYGHTHEKLLICDRKHYINGSFNFLSYAGEDDRFFRNEGSTYSDDADLIEQTIKLRFDF